MNAPEANEKDGSSTRLEDNRWHFKRELTLGSVSSLALALIAAAWGFITFVAAPKVTIAEYPSAVAFYKYPNGNDHSFVVRPIISVVLTRDTLAESIAILDKHYIEVSVGGCSIVADWGEFIQSDGPWEDFRILSSEAAGPTLVPKDNVFRREIIYSPHSTVEKKSGDCESSGSLLSWDEFLKLVEKHKKLIVISHFEFRHWTQRKVKRKCSRELNQKSIKKILSPQNNWVSLYCKFNIF